ncbi:hypothetical protein [Novosphingobium malaysiense]|uniref:Uncharacterized protein n=1 Tax=Novosphingobium malaysiense TaxID=1348853 RepID=A0A0B1ZJB6_9SPHN|nr:hypothetical protein [Novosphingobium malaysiense]KHK89442.1 hypothetical protein LK12_20170 [Novosphingobium malaysiense]
MEEIRDAIYYQQLARYARMMADRHTDDAVARYLRETAIKHERKARQLHRDEGSAAKESSFGSRLTFWRK